LIAHGVREEVVTELCEKFAGLNTEEELRTVLVGHLEVANPDQLIAEVLRLKGHKPAEKRPDGCQENCVLCKKQCVFPAADHAQLIEGKDQGKLRLNTSHGKAVTLTAHMCGESHQCWESCEADGICDIRKEQREVPKDSPYAMSELNTLQKGIKESCRQKLAPFELKHTNVHICSPFAFHRCAVRCPECLNYCTKEPGHSGLHVTDHSVKKEVTHPDPTIPYIRNQKKVDAAPTPNLDLVTCASLCTELARGHYHLKPCKKPGKCDNKEDQGIRHHEGVVASLPDQAWDEVLCETYWNSHGFEAPVARHIREKISKCTHVCALPECKNSKASYCIWKNWHAGEHVFMCSHDKVYFTDIDVAFVCDVTGSMSSYIEASKRTIQRIMKVFSGMLEDVNKIRFAFIAYRDHPPQDSTFVTKVQDFDAEEKVLHFLKDVKAAGGGDTPEAVLDGINDAANSIKWRPDSMKFVFHVLDAPGHGKDWTTTDDGFPKGCPCKLDITEIGRKLNDLKVRYKCMKIGNSLDLTLAKMKGAIGNFEVTELDKASSMEIVVTEIMTRDVLNA